VASSSELLASVREFVTGLVLAAEAVHVGGSAEEA
jgi:hypothetical protein